MGPSATGDYLITGSDTVRYAEKTQWGSLKPQKPIHAAFLREGMTLNLDSKLFLFQIHVRIIYPITDMLNVRLPQIYY